MFEIIILGIIQGALEWLPVSTKSILILVESNIFGRHDFDEILRTILFLHIGTFLAAFVYFHKDIIYILKGLFNYPNADLEQKKLVQFLSLTTIISGVIGFFIYTFLKEVDLENKAAGAIVNIIIGVILIFTGYLQLRKKTSGERLVNQIRLRDGIIAGLVQGLTTIPGLSRSGTTISTLLLLKFKDDIALKLSFLMSLPLILGGNIILNWDEFNFSNEKLIGVFFAFVTGLLTIHLFLKLARKVNFGKFVIFFAVLLIVSGLITFLYN
jgi:undecaprenyl-diphosphatase